VTEASHDRLECKGVFIVWTGSARRNARGSLGEQSHDAGR
jgi:hypothetical protein